MIEKDRSKGEGSWTLTKPDKAIEAPNDKSALTDRTMEEIASAGDAVWRR